MMFNKESERYMTRAIAEELHPEIAIILWQLIDSKNRMNVDLDYLQIFELTETNGKQAIVHRQEEPERQSLLIVPLTDATPITRIVWIMDSIESTVIMFPEDY